ncbi:MAG: hypothetical protein QXV17_15025 [Candidatus Micrarchaeaceae archaeon]
MSLTLVEEKPKEPLNETKDSLNETKEQELSENEPKPKVTKQAYYVYRENGHIVKMEPIPPEMLKGKEKPKQKEENNGGGNALWVALTIIGVILIFVFLIWWFLGRDNTPQNGGTNA